MRRLFFIVLLLVCWANGSAKSSVWEQVVLYPSHDQFGDTLTLSGKLTVPEQPKGIILLPHWTISAADEAPSYKLTAEAKDFVEDYVLIMPDYIGYGVTSNRMHPYLHGELTARNTVDMLLYCQSILDSMALVNIERQSRVNRDSQPDMIEILPGVIVPKMIRKICSMSRVPVICGGLIQEKEDVMNALSSGAAAISTTSSEVWFM